MALGDNYKIGGTAGKAECYITIGQQWQLSLPICTKTSINFMECRCLNNHWQMWILWDAAICNWNMKTNLITRVIKQDEKVYTIKNSHQTNPLHSALIPIHPEKSINISI